MTPPVRAQRLKIQRNRLGKKSTASRFKDVTSVTLLVITVMLLATQKTGHAQSTVLDPLAFANSYLITGNYAVASVDLTGSPDPNGLGPGKPGATATFLMSGVPPDADILAANVYWETITANPSDIAAKFRGTTLDLASDAFAKQTSQELSGSTATCYGSGQQLFSMTMVRADVLRLLPKRLDKDNKPTGKRLVNHADLLAHNEAPLTITLPSVGGNNTPESAGASLFVVYRDTTEPLRKIVVYDGINVQGLEGNQIKSTRQTLRGFYKSASTKSAKITHIGGSGQPNNTEAVFFNGAPVLDILGEPLPPPDGSPGTQLGPADPFNLGSASQRGWQNFTHDVSSLMSPASGTLTHYGETVTTTVTHLAQGAYDCLSSAAIIISTALEDIDHDGLPDGLENTAGGLKDPKTPNFPNGQPLPDLNGMGASSTYSSLPSGGCLRPLVTENSLQKCPHPDLFVEVNAMWAAAGTSYGSSEHPVTPTVSMMTDGDGHNHMPTPEDILRVALVYEDEQITPHFDVGSLTAYHAANPTNDPKKFGVVNHHVGGNPANPIDWVDDYTDDAADDHLIPTALAKGGEQIQETYCDPDDEPCQFPAFAGVVDWKLGVIIRRDAAVKDNGEPITTQEELNDWNNGTGTCCTQKRRRFDHNRKGLFHYLLAAHSRGKPKSPFPCLNSNGEPVPFNANNGTACVTEPPPSKAGENPLFHVPSTVSGTADTPGGHVLLSLGGWDDFVGRPFTRAGTAFHELGHNFGLYHGGLPPIFGSKATSHSDPSYPVPLNSATYGEPNCKPNYLSLMSYLFQVHGLFKDDESLHIDFSRQPHPPDANGANPGINETSLNDGQFSLTPDYRPAWYAPVDSALAIQQTAPLAAKFCTGAKFFSTTLSGDINQSATSLTLTSAVGAPTAPFYIVVDAEIILVSARSGTSCTVTRGQKGTTATNHSNGATVTHYLGMARVLADTTTTAVDWDGNPLTSSASQDVNFDGNPQPYPPTAPTNSRAVLYGFDDWANIRLDQTGAGRNFKSSGDTGEGEGDTGEGEGDTGEGEGDTGEGEGDTGEGEGDTGEGEGDTGEGEGVDRELTVEGARGLGRSRPSALKACQIAISPNCLPPGVTSVPKSDPRFGKVLLSWQGQTYGSGVPRVYRRRADQSGPFVQIQTSPTTSAQQVIDMSNLQKRQYLYRVRMLFTDDTPNVEGPASNTFLILIQ